MRKEEQKKSNRRERGQALIEVTLLFPWIFFLFVGVLDLGFYSYDSICTENAARIAALQTAVNPAFTAAQLQTMACDAVKLEMQRVTNIYNLATTCGAAPLTVTQQTLTCPASVDASGNSHPPDCGPDPNTVSSLVTVTYQSSVYVPIPGILTNQLNLTRLSEVRMIIP
jgi:Flp pilus assembly protein TadG